MTRTSRRSSPCTPRRSCELYVYLQGERDLDKLLEPPPRLGAQQLRPENPSLFFLCLSATPFAPRHPGPLMAMATHDHWVRGAQALDVRVELTILV